MASAGEISVTLGLNTRQFNEGMRQSQARLRQMGTQMRGTINRAGQLGIAMGAAGAAIAVAFGRQQLQSIDNLAKMSDRLGLATEELQGLRRAAELTGVASSSLDMGIQRMTRRIAEAATGSGEAKDAIKELGLEAGDLANMSVEQQFQAIAGAMEGVDNQSTRVRLAFKLFDSEGVALVNTLKLGEQGLKDVRAELDQYGIAISRIDAAQVEAANDAITRAAANLQGVMQRATVDAAPYIEAIAEYFTEATAEAANFGEMASDAVARILTPIKWLADGIHTIRIAFQGAKVVGSAFATGLISAFSYVQTAIARTGESVLTLTRTIADAYNRIPALPDMDTSGIEGLRAEFKASGDAAALLRDSMERTTLDMSRDLQEMLMQPLPSQKIDSFMSEIEQRAVAFRERMKAEMDEAGGGEDGDGGTLPNLPGRDTADSAPTIDTTPITEAQTSMRTLIDLAGDVPEIEFDVDMDAAEDLNSWLNALEKSGIDLGSLGIDESELTQLRETLTGISNRGIDPMTVDIDGSAVDSVRTALARLGEDTDLSKRLEMDTEEVEFAQGLLDRMAETQFDPKAIQIGTEDATRAGAVLRRLQAMKIDDYSVDVDQDEIARANTSLSALSSVTIDAKSVGVNIDQAIAAADALSALNAAQIDPHMLPVDRSQIDAARATFERFVQAQVDPKAVPVDTADMQRAMQTVAQLNDVTIKPHTVPVDASQLQSALDMFQGIVQARQMRPKRIIIDTDAIGDAARQLDSIDQRQLSADMRIRVSDALSTLEKIEGYDLDDKDLKISDEHIEAAKNAVEALQSLSVDLGDVGIDTRTVESAQAQIARLSGATLGEKTLAVDAQAVDAARAALAYLGDDPNVAARVDIDTEEIEFAQGLLDHMAEMQFDPKTMQIGTDDASRAATVLRKLQGIKLDDYSVGVDQHEIARANASLNALSSVAIDAKTIGVNIDQAHIAADALATLSAAQIEPHTLPVDRSQIDAARQTFEQFAQSQVDPKAVPVDTADMQLAIQTVAQLDGIKIDSIDLPMNDDQLAAAQQALQMIAATQIPGKRIAIDDSQIQQSMMTLDVLREKLAAMPAPEQLGAQVNQQRQREAEMEQRRAAMDQRIQMIQQTLMTERELEVEQHEQRIAELQSFGERRLGNAEQINKLIEKEQARHSSRMADIEASNTNWMLSDQTSFLRSLESAKGQSYKAQVGIVTGALADMSAAGARHNEAMFRVNQIAGILNTTISTFEGAQKAIAMLGPIAGPAAAAGIIASGLARVAAIKSMSFSSGGGGSAPTTNAGSPATPVTATGGTAKTVTLNLQGGDSNQQKTTRQIAEEINNLIDDGFQLGRINTA